MTVVRLGAYSVRMRTRTIAVAAVLTAATVAVSTASFEMAPERLLAALTGSGTAAEDFIVWTLTMPRIATGMAVGSCLGIAGAVFQTLTRNPLGSPDFLGLTHGASTGALLAILFTGASITQVTGLAAAGALATGAAIWSLTRGIDPSGYRIVLVGIGMTAILTGVNGYLLTRADIFDASRAVFWLTGDLSGRDWGQAGMVATVLVLGTATAAVLGRGLEANRLGEEAAAGLGVHIGRVRVLALVTASALTAGAVSVSGPLAFVALAAPQVAWRLTAGSRSFLAAGLTGALIVTAADALAVGGIGDRELPTGVVTGVIGGAYLIWLLTVNRRKGVMS
ncbi:iron chelate uptake ABC transporter family permease subunit [Glycomyces halotolerans]